jgi:hypothetical protein
VALLFLEFALQKLSHLGIFLGHFLQRPASLLMARNDGLSFANQLQVSIVSVCSHQWGTKHGPADRSQRSDEIRTPLTTS